MFLQASESNKDQIDYSVSERRTSRWWVDEWDERWCFSWGYLSHWAQDEILVQADGHYRKKEKEQSF